MHHVGDSESHIYSICVIKILRLSYFCINAWQSSVSRKKGYLVLPDNLKKPGSLGKGFDTAALLHNGSDVAVVHSKMYRPSEYSISYAKNKIRYKRSLTIRK